MSGPDEGPGAAPYVAVASACGVLLAVAMGATRGHAMALYSTGLSGEHALWLGWYALVGGAAMLAGARGLARVAVRKGWDARASAALAAGSDATWVVGAGLAATLVAVLLRALVLRGQPLTDDEATYRFAAHLLASGRLWVESRPDKLFFDRQFMINDGRWYTQYFLGWPALMAPLAKAGLTGWLNAALAGLTMPPLYGVARRIAGVPLARAGLVVAVLAPATGLVAATELSHTSCIWLLTTAAWLAWRAGDEDAPPWADTLAALAWSGAFWVRPASAVGAGVGIFALWAWGWWRGGRRPSRLLAAALPAVALLGLFGAAQWALTGSPLRSSYAAMLDYVRANHGRFSVFGRLDFQLFRLDPAQMTAVNLFALVRINESFFGWPVSLAFVPFARIGWAWLWVAGFWTVHLAVADVGIETLGPTHYLELFPAVLWLTLDGVARLAREARTAEARATPGAALVVGSALAVLFAWPVHVGNVGRAARVAAVLPQSVASLDHALVFAPHDVQCEALWRPTTSFVMVRPENTPDVDGPVVWVNHLHLDADRAFWRTWFPDRQGFVFRWSPTCEAELVDLSDPDARVEPGPIGGDGYLEPQYLPRP